MSDAIDAHNPTPFSNGPVFELCWVSNRSLIVAQIFKSGLVIHTQYHPRGLSVPPSQTSASRREMHFGLKMALEMLQYGYLTFPPRTRRIMKYTFWILILLVLILLAVMVGVSLDVNSQSNDIIAQVSSDAGASVF